MGPCGGESRALICKLLGVEVSRNIFVCLCSSIETSARVTWGPCIERRAGAEAGRERGREGGETGREGRRPAGREGGAPPPATRPRAPTGASPGPGGPAGGGRQGLGTAWAPRGVDPPPVCSVGQGGKGWVLCHPRRARCSADQRGAGGTSERCKEMVEGGCLPPLRCWDGVRRAERLTQGVLMAAPRSSRYLQWRYASGSVSLLRINGFVPERFRS